MKERIAALLSLVNLLHFEVLTHLQYDRMEGHNQRSEYSIGNSDETWILLRHRQPPVI